MSSSAEGRSRRAERVFGRVWLSVMGAIIGFVLLAGVGAVLLVVGYVLDVAGIEDAGHAVMGIVRGTLRLVAIVVTVLSMAEAFEWVVGGVLGLGVVGGIAGVLVQQIGVKGIEAGMEWLRPGEVFALLFGVLCLWGIVLSLCHWLGWITMWSA